MITVPFFRITHQIFFFCLPINNDINYSSNIIMLMSAKAKKQETIDPKLLSRDKKTNTLVQKHFYREKVSRQRLNLSSLLHNFQPGYLEPQFQGDQTLKVTQSAISSATNIQTASSMFQLKLNMGSYRATYSRNGAKLMLMSDKGHVSLIDWRQKEAMGEWQMKQKINDGCFLHNDEMFALSQKHNTFIYDNRGIQVHKLDYSEAISYLPYHFLLASHDNRHLKYIDTTTGHLVASHLLHSPYTCMRQNQSNGIIAMGTAKGVVEWWTPGIGTPAVKVFVGSRISDIGFWKGYMWTAEDKLKVWDSRMLKVLHEQDMHRKIHNLQISQSGILAVNYGFKMEYFKDSHIAKQNLPYLKYTSKSTIVNSKFVPFQDLMGLGTANGFDSIVVPGAGMPFYDTFQNNPFQSKKQKREALVHNLLQRLPMQTITVDPNLLGSMTKATKQELEAEDKQRNDKKEKQRIQKALAKKKMKGKSKTSAKINRRNIQLDKLKRAQLTKSINTKLWAKWADKKKKQSEIEFIRQMQTQGLGVADLISKTNKTKFIKKD